MYVYRCIALYMQMCHILTATFVCYFAAACVIIECRKKSINKSHKNWLKKSYKNLTKLI